MNKGWEPWEKILEFWLCVSEKIGFIVWNTMSKIMTKWNFLFLFAGAGGSTSQYRKYLFGHVFIDMRLNCKPIFSSWSVDAKKLRVDNEPSTRSEEDTTNLKKDDKVTFFTSTQKQLNDSATNKAKRWRLNWKKKLLCTTKVEEVISQMIFSIWALRHIEDTISHSAENSTADRLSKSAKIWFQKESAKSFRFFFQ